MGIDNDDVVVFRTYKTYPTTDKDEDDWRDVYGRVAVKWEDIQRVETYNPSEWRHHTKKVKGVVVKFYGSDELHVLVVDATFAEFVDQWSKETSDKL